MCLDYKSYTYKAITGILLLSCVFITGTLHAQNVTSPYSILGIGDIETKDFGRYFGMGSTSIALRDEDVYNIANPASLTALNPHIMHFDFNMRGRISNFLLPNADTLTSTSKDFAVRRISLAFRTNKWAIAAGLKPYSTVNYLLNATSSIANTTNIAKEVDGTGGIYQVYVSNAYKLSNHFSAGITTAFLFGSLKTNTSYANDAIGLSIERDEYNALHGFLFSGGLQYTGKITKNISQQLGITASNKTTLKGEWTASYSTGDTTLSTKVVNTKTYKMPLQLGIGYALIFSNSVTLSADYNFYKYDYLKLNYPNSYIDNASRISFGFQYSKKQKLYNYNLEKYFFQAGFSYETGYIRVQNKPLNDYSFTIGAGSNLTRSISYYAGFEYGIKGSRSYNQIQEKYKQFVIGITLKDLWINTTKYGRYD